MPVERTASPHFHKCWLTTAEYEALRRTTTSSRDELVVLMRTNYNVLSYFLRRAFLLNRTI
jgi:hypothetical protein